MSSNCNEYPIANNYSSLKHTYVKPIQYEGFDCNQYPVAKNYKSLGHTYVNPVQYEGYDDCNKYPVAKDYKSLANVYFKPIQYEAFTNDCNQYPVATNYKPLSGVYVNPVQYEAFNTVKRGGYEIPTANLSATFEAVKNTIPIASASVQQTIADNDKHIANDVTNQLNSMGFGIPPLINNSFKSSGKDVESTSVLPANLNAIASIKQNLKR